MKNKILGITLMVLSVVLLVGLVNAATVINTPAASTTISGTKVFNVTVTEAGAIGGQTLINLTFYAKSTLTANSTWTVIGRNNTINMTIYGNQTLTNINTAVLEDANNYIFNVTAKNSSSGIVFSEDTNTGITVDNTVPTAPSALSPSTNTVVTDAGTQTFSSTVTNAQTTSCTYTIGRGGTSSDSADTTTLAGTYSGSTCSFTKAFSDSTLNGDWYWYTTASDETNTTSSATNVLNVQLAGGGSGGVAALAAAQGTSGTTDISGTSGTSKTNAIVLIILVIGGIYFLTRK